MNNKINNIFDMKRKVIASMTSEGWKRPHVSYVYEADVTEFLKIYNDYYKNNKITFNTMLLKVIIEGIKKAPKMNSIIEYNSFFISGKIITKKEININMPVLLKNGEMVTVNLRDFQNKSLKEMTNYIKDINEKVQNSNIDYYLLKVGLNDTLKELKRGRIIKAIGRGIGCKFGRGKVRKFTKEEKAKIKEIDDKKSLSINDLNKGTITISNIGAAIKDTNGVFALLDLVPPQCCAIGIGTINDKPLVYFNEEKGANEIGIRKTLSFTIAFDHRALDFGLIAPFINELDSIFRNPERIRMW